MSYDSPTSDHARRMLVGVALLVIVVAGAIAAYQYLPSAFPSSMFLGTIVFTVVMLVIGVLAQETASRRSGN